MTAKFNSITVCDNQEDFDAIKNDIQFPCVVLVWNNTQANRELWLDMVFGTDLPKSEK